MPLIIFPGMVQLAMPPLAETCIAPRIAASILPPLINPNDVAESKIEAPLPQRHRLLPGIDQIRILITLVRVGANPEQPVLRLQHQFHAFGDVVRHQCGQSYTQVHVAAVAQLGRSSRGHLVARPTHDAASVGLARTVVRSMRLSAACAGVNDTTRCT